MGENIKFERRIPAPDEIHAGIQFNEYHPEGRVFTMKDVVLGALTAFLLLAAYCVAGYLELGV